MLLGLYEKEPFSMNTNVEELECNVWGGYYDMDMTTAQISFNDNNSLTAYGNFITEFISGWTELLSRKDSISEELFQEDFAAWKTEIFEKAEQLDTMERIRNAKNAGDYLKSPQIFTIFPNAFLFPTRMKIVTRLSLQMYHS